MDLLRLLIIVVAFAVMCPATAQTNPYGIRGELYNMYVEAYRTRTTPEGLNLAKRMYSRAKQVGDNKGQCLAYTIAVAHYYHKPGESRKFMQTVKQLQDMAEKFGEEQFFYYGVTNKVNYLLTNNRNNEATAYTYKAEEYARQKHHQFGLYICLCAIGQTYIASREIYTALEYFKQAYNMTQESLKGIDEANILRKFAECYAEVYDYGLMREYSLKALNASRTDITRLRSLPILCIATFMSENYDEFKKYYDMYEQLKKTVSADSSDPEERNVAILKMLYDRDFEKAYNYIMKKKRALPRLRMLAELYKLSGATKSYALTNRMLYRIQVNDADSVRSMNFDNSYANILNLRLEMMHSFLHTQRNTLDTERKDAELRNAHLQLTNTQLSLKNSSLDLARAKSEAEMLRLSYNRKQLEAAKLRGDIKAAQAHKEFNEILSGLGVMVTMILIVGAGFYLWSNTKLMTSLQDTNDSLAKTHEKLVVAKQHAVEASNVKQAFINNMSNDIQSPLNAIASLASQMAESKGKLPKEQCQELSAKINSNTTQLLDIIGKVIKNM